MLPIPKNHPAFNYASKVNLIIQVSLAHLFFNMVGFLLWFVVPFARRLPIRLALWAGAETEKYRWWAFCYIIGLFLAFPGLAFILSLVAPIFSDKVTKLSISVKNALTSARLYETRFRKVLLRKNYRDSSNHKEGVLYLLIFIIILSIAIINHLRSTKPEILPEVLIITHRYKNQK